MFRVIICDDNIFFANREKKMLEDILSNYELDEYEIKIFETGNELLSNVSNYKNVDLILMDVELSDNNGLEILKTIGGMFNGVIAIVSSFIDYAPEGYKVNAFRYLVKSSMEFEEGLREIVEHAYDLFSLSEHKIYEYNFREKLYSFELNNLKYIESKLHYVYFYFRFDKRIYSIRKTLDQIEVELSNYKMIRIHKSILVNADYISDIRKFEVELLTGEVLNVAQGKYEEVIEKYGCYIGARND